MPYRIDLDTPPAGAIDALIDLGALDVEAAAGGLAALMPDSVSADAVAGVLGLRCVRVSPAAGRDDDSIWTLSLRPVRTGSFQIVPATTAAPPGALRILDAPAFGTGLHATTALCLQAIDDLSDQGVAERVLDVGTGSGILSLAALRRGVRHAVGLDIDPAALAVARENARLNDLSDRFSLVRGGPEALRGSWPLVVANIRAAELMALAPVLVRRVASGGRLTLSGIPHGVSEDVDRVYRRLGMRRVSTDVREGWASLVLRPSW